MVKASMPGTRRSARAIISWCRRVMEKAGLRFVRSFHLEWPVRVPGDEEGDVEYALTREQWLSDRGER